MVCQPWKYCLKQTLENTNLLVVEDYHFTKGLKIDILEKLNSRELYSVLISAIDHQPNSQKYFNKLILNTKLLLEKIYLIVGIVTVNSYLCCFLNKIVNMLYLNKKLFTGKTDTRLSSFHRTEAEISLQLFYKCFAIKLWNQLKSLFTTDFYFNLITNDK